MTSHHFGETFLPAFVMPRFGEIPVINALFCVGSSFSDVSGHKCRLAQPVGAERLHWRVTCILVFANWQNCGKTALVNGGVRVSIAQILAVF